MAAAVAVAVAVVAVAVAVVAAPSENERGTSEQPVAAIYCKVPPCSDR